jgi:energy-coupling factor transporter ATP-binding protein EcfA2
MGSASAADVLRRSSGGDAAGVSDERMYRVMKQLGLPPPVQHTPAASLSGGERARLCLAQMLLSGATVLICDEPTNHLDLEARAYLLEALRYFDGAVLLTSHDRHFAAAAGTRFVEILDGAVHSAAAYGPKLPFATKYGLAQEAGGEVAKANRGKRRRSKQNKHGRLLLTSGILGDRTAAEASTAADGWDALICEPPPKASEASGAPLRMRSNLLARARVVPGTRNKKQGKAFWKVHEESKLHPRWHSR